MRKLFESKIFSAYLIAIAVVLIAVVGVPALFGCYAPGHVHEVVPLVFNIFVAVLILLVIGIIFLFIFISRGVRESDRYQQDSVQLEKKNATLRRTFGMLVPNEMAHTLIDSPDSIRSGSDMREVTVLQSDIRGFSELIQPMTAADAIDMLNHYFEMMTIVINRHGGNVVEFQGDGILAIFDSKTLGDRHADRAVFAAIEMQNSMENVDRWNSERNYPCFEMGIGINTGDAYVGWIGSKERIKYDALGTTINFAARIESYSTGGQVIISESCRDKLTISIDVANEYKVLPKGSYSELLLTILKGIGEPYNLPCRMKDEVPKKLPESKMIRFRVVENKNCGMKEYAGMVISASATSAMMITAAPITLFDNLRIEDQGVISAKVVSRSVSGFLLRFTSVPPSFDGWGAVDR